MRQYVDKDFTYSVPAVNNVKIWRVTIESVGAKEFGIMRPGSISYKDRVEADTLQNNYPVENV